MAEDSFDEIIRIQQMMSERLRQEQRTDSKIDMLDMINELTDGGTKRVQTEAVLVEAQARGTIESEAMRLLDDLQKDHLIRHQGGFVERT